MPIFEYVCRECKNDFEALVRSETIPECPNCHSTELEKMLSVFATTASAPHSKPAAAGPCGSCPNAQGPCAFN